MVRVLSPLVPVRAILKDGWVVGVLLGREECVKGFSYAVHGCGGWWEVLIVAREELNIS